MAEEIGHFQSSIIGEIALVNWARNQVFVETGYCFEISIGVGRMVHEGGLECPWLWLMEK